MRQMRKHVHDTAADARAPAGSPAAEARRPRPVLVATGEEPMTRAEAAYLRSLSSEAGEPEAFDATLSRRQALRRIEALKDRLGLLDPPPHTD
jgi:hypothetical protein